MARTYGMGTAIRHCVRLFALLLAMLALAVAGPAALASPGCSAVNSGVLNGTATFSGTGTPTDTGTVEAGNLTAFVSDRATTLAFNAGDKINYTLTIGSNLYGYLRYNAPGANYLPGFQNTSSGSYSVTLPAGVTKLYIFSGRTATDRNGTVVASATCVAAPLAAPVITAPANNAVLTTSNPTISGTGVPGARVKLQVNTASAGMWFDYTDSTTHPTVSAGGTWSYTFPDALYPEATSVRAQQSDDETTWSTDSNTVNLSFAAGAPLITGAQGIIVHTSGGLTRIVGSNLATVTSLTVGGVPATIVSTAAGQIDFRTPAIAAGDYAVRVESPGGDSTFSRGVWVRSGLTNSASFSAATIDQGQTSRLTFTLTQSAPTFQRNRINFTAALPAGLEVAAVPNATSSGCNVPAGLWAPGAGATTLSLGTGAGNTPNMPTAVSSCTFSVDVTATTPGAKTVTPSEATSLNSFERHPGETPVGATLTVNSSLSSVATLSNLALSSGTLAPAFAGGTTGYAASVGNAVTSIAVTPTVTHAAATVKVNGAAVASGSPSGAIALNVGANAITIVVTAEDGSTTSTYTVNVTRAGSSVSTLSGLALSSGALSPAFAGGTSAYSASVANAVAAITVTPSVTDPNATIKVDGAAVTSGSPSAAIPLNIGSNTITVVVTAQDGVTTTTYTVSVTRAASSVATLSGLAISTGTLSPVFAGNTLGYAVAVDSAVTSVTLTATVTDDGATVKVNGVAATSGGPSGPIALDPGANAIPVLVTAQDGTTTVTYTVTITRGESAPVAGNVSATVTYGSSGNPITLSLSGGPASSVAVAAAPAHGTATVSAQQISYTPAAGYFGADSFTYTATGPGGASPAATVSVTVSPPGAPQIASLTPAIGPTTGGTHVIVNGSNFVDVRAVRFGTTAASAFTLRSDSQLEAVAPAGTATVDVTVEAAGGVSAAAGPADDFSYALPATATGGFTAALVAPGAPALLDITITNPNAIAIPLPEVEVIGTTSLTADPAASQLTGCNAGLAAGASCTLRYAFTAGGAGTGNARVGVRTAGGLSPIVSADIAIASAPSVADVSADLAFGSPGQAITLQPSGAYASLAIATQPAHGSVTLSGVTATYVPAAGYFGADSFTYTATGPGGTSAAATVRITVATPPPPVPAPANVSAQGATVEGGSSADVNLSDLVQGTFSSIQISAQPHHGTVTLSGGQGAASNGAQRTLAIAAWVATYTPNSGFAGSDSFQFVAIGPGGMSAPATVTVTVVGVAPTAQPKTAATGDNQLVSVDLLAGAVGGPITGATIDAITPASSGAARIVQGGTSAAPTFRLEVTPAAHFGGAMVVTYRLANVFGQSAPATVTVTVTARPDPTADPNIRAISDAQAETTRRFARAQTRNFMARTQQLHNGGVGTTGSMGVRFNLQAPMLARQAPDMTGADEAIAFAEWKQGWRSDPGLRGVTRLGGYGGGAAEPLRNERPASAAAPEGDGARAIGSIGIWTGGGVDISVYDQRAGRAKITLSTGGLSGGADVRLAETLTIGVGGGYASDLSRIGENGEARVRSSSSMVALYGSFAPVEHGFIDGVIGRGDLDFRTRRLVAANAATALGTRKGDMTFAALSFGIDRSEAVQWSAYGRGEWLRASLDGYVESGAGRYDLRFDARDIDSLTGVLGARVGRAWKWGEARIEPKLQIEWLHEFSGAGLQRLDYADFAGPAVYDLRALAWQRDQFELGAGTQIVLPSWWVLALDVAYRGARGESTARFGIGISRAF